MNGSRLLIIEDGPTLLRGLKDTFVAKGCEVISAVEGEEGLDLALSSQTDLVLLDIMLPKMNGYEVCPKSASTDCTCQIILLTAKGQEEDIVLRLEFGSRRLRHQAVQDQNWWPASTPSYGGGKSNLLTPAASAITS